MSNGLPFNGLSSYISGPSQNDLMNVITGGVDLNSLGRFGYGSSTSQPSVNMEATAYSTPVKLMQKFVNNRGWGDVDVTGMKDWQGNTLTNQTMAGFNANANNNNNADADKWMALAMLLKQMQTRMNGEGYNYSTSSSHNSTGAGGSGR
jgi:hypothetical protein